MPTEKSSSQSTFPDLLDTKSSKIKLISHSTTLKPNAIREHSEGKIGHYKILKNFWEILRRTLWVDRVNSIPWIHAITGELPIGKTNYLSHYLVDKNDVSKYSVKFNKDSVKKIRDWGSRWSSTVTTPIRKGMEELFLRFVTLDWAANTSIFRNSFASNKLAEVQIDHFLSMSEDYPTHIIRLIRKYQGRKYYLDIVFNSETGKNQLYIPLIRTRKMFFQPNGEVGTSQKYIGGSQDSINKLDREFASMFDQLDENPSNFYKQLTIMGTCLEEYSYCGSLLSMRGHHKMKSPAKDKQENRIHPFADIYERVSDSWQKRLSTFDLKWANTFKS